MKRNGKMRNEEEENTFPPHPSTSQQQQKKTTQYRRGEERESVCICGDREWGGWFVEHSTHLHKHPRRLCLLSSFPTYTFAFSLRFPSLLAPLPPLSSVRTTPASTTIPTSLGCDYSHTHFVVVSTGIFRLLWRQEEAQFLTLFSFFFLFFLPRTKQCHENNHTGPSFSLFGGVKVFSFSLVFLFGRFVPTPLLQCVPHEFTPFFCLFFPAFSLRVKPSVFQQLCPV